MFSITDCLQKLNTKLPVGFLTLYWPIIIPLGPILKAFSKGLLTEKKLPEMGHFSMQVSEALKNSRNIGLCICYG